MWSIAPPASNVSADSPTTSFAQDGASGDFFGEAVALGGNTVVTGARNNDVNGENAGSAYAYELERPMEPTPAVGVPGVVLLALVLLGWGVSYLYIIHDF